MVEDNKKKYDRQLRIWGEHGQAALESCNVCLLNGGPTGSETLKNLVLGGIASYTVVDSRKVENSDLGNNFMLDAGSLGQARAKAVCDFLQELNPSVEGRFVEEEPSALLQEGALPFFDAYSLVVATQLPEHHATALDKYLRARGTVLVIARSYGLVGCLRISVEEHRVVEAKPESKVDDLRLHAPWPELAAHAAAVELGSLDDRLHKHVPWGVLLLQATSLYCQGHGGALPKSRDERNELKDILRGMRRSLDEENFEEALANVHRVWAPPPLSSELRAVLDDPAAAEVTAATDDFWVLVAALSLFLQESGGQLPLEGSLPDMTSTTEFYLELQEVYRAKAAADQAALAAHAAAVLRAAGLPDRHLAEPVVKLFCKNAAFLQAIRYRTVAEEVQAGAERGAYLTRQLGMEDRAANAALYVLLSAADHFHQVHARFPGELPGEVEEEEVLKLKSAATSLLTDCAAPNAIVPDDLVTEMCRFGGAELHAVAAVVGGMAAQEAIKLITKQFVPLTGTLIYNAITSTTSLFEY